jgi:hypothetical protein
MMRQPVQRLAPFSATKTDAVWALPQESCSAPSPEPSVVDAQESIGVPKRAIAISVCLGNSICPMPIRWLSIRKTHLVYFPLENVGGHPLLRIMRPADQPSLCTPDLGFWEWNETAQGLALSPPLRRSRSALAHFP